MITLNYRWGLVLLLCTMVHWAAAQASRFYTTTPVQLPANEVIGGAIAVKLTTSAANELSRIKAGGISAVQDDCLRTALQKAGVVGADSLFATAYRTAIAFENGAAINQMNDAGLARWWTLRLAANADVNRAWQLLGACASVQAVSPFLKFSTHQQPNDAQFGAQWHLQNTGQSGGLAGADIKAVPAWSIQTGDSSVLVSVHDGGLLVTHPDLAGNIWRLKGYNFVADNTNLTPDEHGTHVAGLLAAVRNNATGVAGVAGGKTQQGDGVKMMSLQIVGGTPVSPGYEANSFVYAANNGSAISQNSWSYNAANFFPAYTADAIDYFIRFGGGGLLNGGVVVFSAGNFNTDAAYYPQAYDGVIAVAATNHRDVRASYSNYGNWVDISAPGGDAEALMLSTVLNNGYGMLNGTSMSCPLVSGGAALLLSHLKGRVLAQDIRSLLLYGTDNIYPLNAAFMNGKLGTGRLNLAKALLRADSLAALPVLPAVSGVKVDTLCNQVRLRWNAPVAGMQVMVALQTSGNFIGLPFSKNYAVGDTIPLGGVVVYKGADAETLINLPIDGSRIYLRLWTTNADGSNYSIGTDVSFTVPQTLVTPAFTSTTNTINLTWQRQCPQSGLLLLYNDQPLFGRPAGNPADIVQLAGGGTKLQYGNQTQYVHQGLQPDKPYYYAFYAYRQDGNAWTYSDPIFLNAFTFCQPGSLPVQESFTAGDFPPPAWRIVDGGPQASAIPDGRTWQRSTLAGSTNGDQASALINAYTQNGGGSVEVLRAPAIIIPADADSVYVVFDYAYRAYNADPALADSLELVWSDDCGTTFRSIWKAGGAGLASVSGFSTAEFVPQTSADWRKMQFDLSQILPKGRSVNLAFRATNKFGQNIWLDNIFMGFVNRSNDAAIVGWAAAFDSLVCSADVQPMLELANRGTETLQNLVVKWKAANAAVDSVALNNLNMASGSTKSVSLKTISLPEGNTSIAFWTAKPNGLEDADPSNDTLNTYLVRMPARNLPLTEGFEGSLDASGFTSVPLFTSWKTTASAAYAGSQSIAIDRFANNSVVATRLLSPMLPGVASVDSVKLQFAVSTAMKQNGPGQIMSDTLEAYLSNDCGKTRQLIYRKAGAALAVNGKVQNQPFVPVSKSDWRYETIDLTTQLGNLRQNWQVEWRLLPGGGNNIYLDQVTVSTKTIPAALKENGFGAYPNPFSNRFIIWHLKPVPEWQSATLVNLQGQVLQQWKWNGNAPQTLEVNGVLLSQGLYLVHLQYKGFSRTIKMMKW